MHIRIKSTISMICVVACLITVLPTTSEAEQVGGLSNGQTIYVPAYSHIYSGNRERPFLLTVTLSIRNIDPDHAITITAADYFETQGALINKYVDSTITLGPLESIRYVVPEQDEVGGSGANFIVVWSADQPVNPPIAESIMIGTQSQQGISFTSRGVPVLPTR